MSHAFSLGQELYFEPVTSYRPAQKPLHELRSVAVTKIGRVWITVKSATTSYRFEPEPDDEGLLWTDGGDYGSPGRIWLTREAHADYSARIGATGKILSAFRAGHAAPRQIPTEMLVAMAALLPTE